MRKKFKELLNNYDANWNGLTFGIFVAMLIIAIILLYAKDPNGVQGGYIRNNFIIILSILAVFGTLVGEIGDRIPIWNKYVGGGTVLVFLVATIFATYGIFPEVFAGEHGYVAVFYNEEPVRFIEIFIPTLIVGSVITVNRKVLIKSVSGYMIIIVIGVIGATIGGVGLGLLLGKDPIDLLLNYVLPIMGGGTGAGAIPMAEIYESATGISGSEWFGFAISILTIANILAIITAGILNGIGEKKPHLTGNGQLLKTGNNQIIEKEDWESVPVEKTNIAAAIFFTGILFAFAHLLSELWLQLLSPILGFDLHRLAILVILVIILNVSNLVPAVVKASAKGMQKFIVKNALWILMAAIGVATDFNEVIKAFTIPNLIVALGIVLGAVTAIMLTARFFKFYPIEAAITAGLCMANRGGTGDVAVLGAANRMELISFAQISSRIGGAIMLIVAGILFSALG